MRSWGPGACCDYCPLRALIKSQYWTTATLLLKADFSFSGADQLLLLQLLTRQAVICGLRRFLMPTLPALASQCEVPLPGHLSCLKKSAVKNGSTSVYFGMTTGLTMPFFTRQMCEPVVLSCLKPSFSKMHFSTRQCSGARRGIPRLGGYEWNGYAKPVRLLFGGVFRPAGCRRRVESGLAQDYFEHSSL